MPIDDLFKKWDLDGNGVADMQEVCQVLDVLNKQTPINKGQRKSEKKFIHKFMAQLRYKYDDPNAAPLSPVEFRELMSGLTAEFADDDDEYLRHLSGGCHLGAGTTEVGGRQNHVT